jgi:hypothetical protein
MYKFADDITVMQRFTKGNTDSDFYDLISEIDHIKNWCSTNNQFLNKTKTKSLTIKSTNNSIPDLYDDAGHCLEVDFINFLGIYIDKKLTWTKHIKSIVTKCSQRLHILRILRGHIDEIELLQVYNAIIRSLMEYACPAFVGLNNKLSKKLEKIQRRALGIIFYDKPESIIHLNIDSIHERRIRLALKLFNKMQTPLHILHDLLPDIMPRTKHYRLPTCVSNRRLNSFLPFTTIMYNNLL